MHNFLKKSFSTKVNNCRNKYLQKRIDKLKSEKKAIKNFGRFCNKTNATQASTRTEAGELSHLKNILLNYVQLELCSVRTTGH